MHREVARRWPQRCETASDLQWCFKFCIIWVLDFVGIGAPCSSFDHTYYFLSWWCHSNSFPFPIPQLIGSFSSWPPLNSSPLVPTNSASTVRSLLLHHNPLPLSLLFLFFIQFNVNSFIVFLLLIGSETAKIFMLFSYSHDIPLTVTSWVGEANILRS